MGDHIYGDSQAGGSVVSGAGGFSATSFPSFESAGAGGADQRAGDVVGQLPHLLALFSPSPVEMQGLVECGDRASERMRGGSERGALKHSSSNAHHASTADSNDSLNHLNDGYDPALALSRPWFTDPLHEPHLPGVVAEIGEPRPPPPLLSTSLHSPPLIITSFHHLRCTLSTYLLHNTQHQQYEYPIPLPPLHTF